MAPAHALPLAPAGTASCAQPTQSAGRPRCRSMLAHTHHRASMHALPLANRNPCTRAAPAMVASHMLGWGVCLSPVSQQAPPSEADPAALLSQMLVCRAAAHERKAGRKTPVAAVAVSEVLVRSALQLLQFPRSSGVPREALPQKASAGHHQQVAVVKRDTERSLKGMMVPI